MNCERVSEILDAYLDGQIDPPAARDIDWHLTDCPRCSRQLAARRALQQALRAKLPYYQAPASLRTPDVPQPDRRLVLWRRTALALAACLVVSIGALTASILNRPGENLPPPAVPLGELVASIHLRSLQGATGTGSAGPALAGPHLLDVVSTDQHTVKPWFAGKLPFAPVVRDLAADGFPLIGGRLEMVLDHPAAALVYRRDKHVINLLMWPASPEAWDENAGRKSFTTAGGFHEVAWTKSGIIYWAVSDVEMAELERFAQCWNNPAAAATEKDR